MNRRQFIFGVTAVSLGSAVLSACGQPSSDGGSGALGNQSCNDGGVSTYTNPGHAHTTIGLTTQQLAAAIPANYQLMGGSHNHFFNLTAQDFATLQAGGTVNKVDIEGHGHSITISC